MSHLCTVEVAVEKGGERERERRGCERSDINNSPVCCFSEFGFLEVHTERCVFRAETFREERRVDKHRETGGDRDRETVREEEEDFTALQHLLPQLDINQSKTCHGPKLPNVSPARL